MNKILLSILLLVSSLASAQVDFSSTPSGDITARVKGGKSATLMTAPSDYEEWSGTVTLTGGYASNPTGTAFITRTGRSVKMNVASIVGTSNATTNPIFSFSDTGANIPTRFAPITTQFISGQVTVMDNGVVNSSLGSANVGSTIITLSTNTGGGTNSFTATANKGVYHTNIFWDIR